MVTMTVWEQATRVRMSVMGGAWQGRFTAPAPVPGWLVDLVDGRIGVYAGPDPVLFRTAGIGLGEWLDARHDRPEQLHVTCAHSTTPFEVFEDAAAVLTGLADTTDADVYVWGDGRVEGLFCAHIHRVFATLSPDVTVWEAGTQLERLSDRFHVVLRPGTVELAPRLERIGRRA